MSCMNNVEPMYCKLLMVQLNSKIVQRIEPAHQVVGLLILLTLLEKIS